MSTVRAIDQEEVPFRYGLYRGSTQLGQVDFHIEPSVPDEAWLGALPPKEMVGPFRRLPVATGPISGHGTSGSTGFANDRYEATGISQECLTMTCLVIV